MSDKPRCAWVGDEALYKTYHDEEWGVPCHDDRALFELLILEGAQAGLSWITILKKRENYRRLFDNFDATKIARYTPKRIDRLLQDPGIVRNRLKVESTVTNARAFLELQGQPGGFSGFVWSFVDGRPIRNHPRTIKDVAVTTPESDALSKALKQRGFKFVGSTICYAFMQAAGLVDDHTVDCFRHRRGE
ncbi:MAG: DNA-3-methyladenine glycosylase I [Candidatus Thiodiazotropha sp.]